MLSFKVERSENADFSWPMTTFTVNDPSATSYDDSGYLPLATRYYYRVRATAGGSGGWWIAASDASNVASFTTPPDIGVDLPPAVLTNRTVDEGATLTAVVVPIGLKVPYEFTLDAENNYTVWAYATAPAAHPITRWYADFGDGTVQAFDVTPDALPGDGNSHRFDHHYPGPGYQYTVTLSARNDQGVRQVVYTVQTGSGAVAGAGRAPNPYQGLEELRAAPASEVFAAHDVQLLCHDLVDTGCTGVPEPTEAAYTVDWGDGSDPDAIGPYNESCQQDFTFDHTYALPGKYTLSLTNTKTHIALVEEMDVTEPRPIFSGPTGVIVLPGQAVDVTETFDNLNPNVLDEAFVDLGDGRGPQSTPIQRDGGGSLSGSIFVHLDHAPSFGEVGPHVTLYDMTLVNYPYTTRKPAAQTGFGVLVWSVSLGDGTNNATLAASADGTRNLQPLTVSFPHDWGEAFDITLTTTNAREDLVWDTLTPGPGDVPVLGAGTTSYTFRSDPNSTANSSWHVFYVGATTGDTAYDCLSYSFTATEDAAASVQPPSPYQFLPTPTSAATSNAASNIEMRFETAKDGNSQPILTDNNPASVAAGSSGGSSDSSDPTPPVASLTKVDLIYPSELVGQVPITFVTDAARLRFWSSASEGSLIVGGLKRGITFGNGVAPTTLYADLTDRPGDVVGATTFTCNNVSSTATAVGMSLSVDALAPGDPNATIPLETSSSSNTNASGNAAQEATIRLNLPTSLANGTTVTLSIDPSLAQLVDVANAFGDAAEAAFVLGKDAGGATTITWTVGSANSPPAEIKAFSFGTVAWLSQFFDLEVQAPTTGSATQPVAAATQPAVAGDIFTQLHDAVVKHDWALADKLAILAKTAFVNGARPTDGKTTNPNDKLHIVVTMLGKTDNAQGAGGIFLGVSPQKQQLTFKQMGLPDFPDQHYTVPSGFNGVYITETLLVQIVGGQGINTGGYTLHADVINDVMTFDDRPTDVHASPRNPTVDDFGHFPFFYKQHSGKLRISASSNWYIDTPFMASNDSHLTGRFFQTHVYVTDKAGNRVEGLEATYGYAYRVHYDPTDFSKSTVEWEVWGQKLNADVIDPKEKVTEDPSEFLQDE